MNEKEDILTTILDKVEAYYTDKIRQFGATFKGVDWPSEESQRLRFQKLLRVCEGSNKFSLNDYGCGYGALFQYMIDNKFDFEYFGYDISNEMIKIGQSLFSGYKNSHFYREKKGLPLSDFTVASGIFNVKRDIKKDEWQEYVLDIIDQMAYLSKKGFSFNILSKYADAELMRDDLYYADPEFYLTYCRKNISKDIFLSDDYGLYEFTINVRK